MIALMSRGTLRSDCLERSLGPTRCLAIPSGSVIALRNDTVETRDMSLERRHHLHQPRSPHNTVSSQSPASEYGSEGWEFDYSQGRTNPLTLKKKTTQEKTLQTKKDENRE